MKKLGKILIAVGFVLIGIPLLYAIIYSFCSSNLLPFDFLRHIGNRMNLMGNLEVRIPSFLPQNYFGYSCYRWCRLWLFVMPIYVSQTPYIYPFSLVFRPLLLLFIPNIFIISGFSILVNQNKKIEMKKCFNPIVIIGFLLGIFIFLRSFGLLNYLHQSIFNSWRFLNPMKMRLLPFGTYRILTGIIYIIFHIIPAVPTFVITLGYMKFFEKEETQSSVNVSNGSISIVDMKKSYFDGGLLSFIGWSILGGLITFFTLGICYPWAVCMVYGWKINHTTIDGKRLKFNGKAISLFGHWILWGFLTIITLGIFSFWLNIALEKWKVKNTSFVDSSGAEKPLTSDFDNKRSYFDGGLLSFIGWKIAGFFITLFTLGICYPWSVCMIYRWETNHSVIEGERKQFNGKALSLFGHWILWAFLTFITFGIYGFWLNIALEKWKVKNTTFEKVESSIESNQ